MTIPSAEPGLNFPSRPSFSVCKTQHNPSLAHRNSSRPITSLAYFLPVTVRHAPLAVNSIVTRCSFSDIHSCTNSHNAPTDISLKFKRGFGKSVVKGNQKWQNQNYTSSPSQQQNLTFFNFENLRATSRSFSLHCRLSFSISQLTCPHYQEKGGQVPRGARELFHAHCKRLALHLPIPHFRNSLTLQSWCYEDHTSKHSTITDNPLSAVHTSPRQSYSYKFTIPSFGIDRCRQPT